MPQHLRVAGWLRFANRAALTRALKTFAEYEAPSYFAVADWRIEGLDTHLAINRELPGDFDDVGVGFWKMASGARHGYVDYFETGGSGPSYREVRRWACGLMDKRWPLGRDVPFVADDEPMLLSGSLSFADAAVAAQAIERLPLRLPVLGETGLTELVIDRDAVRANELSLAAAATIVAPPAIYEDAILEALSAIAAPAKSGSLHLTRANRKHRVKAGSKRDLLILARPAKIVLGPDCIRAFGSDVLSLRV